jgi:hypothetical protein
VVATLGLPDQSTKDVTVADLYKLLAVLAPAFGQVAEGQGSDEIKQAAAVLKHIGDNQPLTQVQKPPTFHQTKQRAEIVNDQKLFIGKILGNFPRILSKGHNDRFCSLIEQHVVLKVPSRTTVYRRRFQSQPLSQIRGMIAEMWGNVDALFTTLQTQDVRGFAQELMKCHHVGPMVALDATRTMSLAYGWHLGKDAFPTPLGKQLGSMRHTSSLLPEAMRTPKGVQTFLSSMRPFGAACSELAWRQIKVEFPFLVMYDRLVAFLFKRPATCLCVEMMSCEYKKVEAGLQYQRAPGGYN